MIKLRPLVEASVSKDFHHNVEGGSRSIELERSLAKKVFERKCGEYRTARSTGSQIFRGLLHAGPHPFRFVRPAKSYRMARNTDNFANAILDLIPSWRDWPKRSKSIICSSSSTGAGWYGKVFEVFPFDGAIIGICPATDFWNSFPIIGERLSKTSDHFVEWFNYAMPDVLKTLGYTADYWRYTPEDAQKLFQYLDKKIQGDPKIFDTIFKAAEELGMHKDTKNIFLDMQANFKTAESYFDGLLDPEKNGFKKFPMSEYHTGLNVNREVWTESDSLMIAPQAMHLIDPPREHGINVTNPDGTKEFWPIKGKIEPPNQRNTYLYGETSRYN